MPSCTSRITVCTPPVINSLTSGVAVHPRAFWGAYAATKAGLETLVRCWADENEHTALRAVILDPGKMRTRMRAEAFPGEEPDSLPSPEEIGPLVIDVARVEGSLADRQADITLFEAMGPRLTAMASGRLALIGQ